MIAPVRIRLTGGLGNQLFSICAGFLVSKIKNKGLQIEDSYSRRDFANRDKLITGHWSDFDFSFLARQLKAFESNFSNSKKLHPVDFERVISRKLGIDRKVFEKLVSGKIESIRRGYIPPLGNHFEAIEIPDRAISLNFPKSLELSNPSDAFVREWHRIVDDEAIAVHVRLGDFKTWNNGKFLLPPDYYLQALGKMRELLPDRSIWVFSDEMDLAAQILNPIQGLRLMTPELGLSASEQLKIMSGASGIVASKSSFSWWAAYWSAERSTVISPHEGWRKSDWISIG